MPTEPSDDEKLLTKGEVAQLCRVDVRTVDRWLTAGKLGLTDEEENQIVAFLQTLSDGYTKPYPNRDTFTGRCRVGGSASTQGNESLIPTPPLPPCATAVCGVAPVPSPPIP